MKYEMSQNNFIEEQFDIILGSLEDLDAKDSQR